MNPFIATQVAQLELEQQHLFGVNAKAIFLTELGIERLSATEEVLRPSVVTLMDQLNGEGLEAGEELDAQAVFSTLCTICEILLPPPNGKDGLYGVDVLDKTAFEAACK